MTALLALAGYLGLGVAVGLLVAYSVRNGRRVVGGIFGLPEPDRPAPQDPDPAPRWRFRSQ